MSDSNAASDSLLEFPCDFPIKVMGRQADDFQRFVVDLIARHAPQVQHSDVNVRASRNKRYLSVTVMLRAESKAQLDAIYRDLSKHKRVLMAL